MKDAIRENLSYFGLYRKNIFYIMSQKLSKVIKLLSGYMAVDGMRALRNILILSDNVWQKKDTGLFPWDIDCRLKTSIHAR